MKTINKWCDMWRVSLIALIVLMFVGLSNAQVPETWHTHTPLGITIKAYTSTITQYNHHWATFDSLMFPRRPYKSGMYGVNIGPKWKNIDWSVIDDYYTLLQDGYNSSKANPRTLVIWIRPLSYSAVDESSYPYWYEFSYPDYGNIDGIYSDTNVIMIHLGDDSGMEWWGQLNKPFCATALDWELFHYFLKYKGDSCWWDEFNPRCTAKYIRASELCD